MARRALPAVPTALFRGLGILAARAYRRFGAREAALGGLHTNVHGGGLGKIPRALVCSLPCFSTTSVPIQAPVPVDAAPTAAVSASPRASA